MSRKKLPIYWGNYYWYQHDNGTLSRQRRLGSRSKNRIDYSNFQIDTADFSEPEYTHLDLRKQLKQQIIEDELSKNKNAKDDKPFFYMVAGGTASGKSSLVESISTIVQEKSYIEINYDKIKEEIPEYKAMKYKKNKKAAQLVQHESAKITGALLKKSIREKYNIIYEFNFSEERIILERIKQLRKKKYSNLILFCTFVDIDTAIERENKRAKKTGRYVPEEYIRESYKKIPYNIKKHMKLFDSTLLVDNRTGKFQSFLFYDTSKGILVKKEAVYKEYLDIVGVENSLPI